MTARARPGITAVHVVVPAQDEERHVVACLESVARAAAALHDHRRSAGPAGPETTGRTVTASVLVVLDACTDATGSLVADLGVPSLGVAVRSVGAARRAGVELVRRRVLAAGDDPAAVLVVNTDADCVVPASWLVDLVALADGADVVLGEVEPDPSEMSDDSLAEWWTRHPRGRGSLHGANLAVRLDAYVRAGGFAAVPVQEDVLLVRALRASGATVVGGTRVVTSGRRDGRVPDGFAGYLRLLDAELAAGPAAPPPGGSAPPSGVLDS